MLLEEAVMPLRMRERLRVSIELQLCCCLRDVRRHPTYRGVSNIWRGDPRQVLRENPEDFIKRETHEPREVRHGHLEQVPGLRPRPFVKEPCPTEAVRGVDLRVDIIEPHPSIEMREVNMC